MKDETQENKAFLTWAKQVNTQHPEILDHMRKSTDPLERAIAVRIMKNAGVSEL